MRLIDGDALRDKSFIIGKHPTVNNPYRDLDEVVSGDDIDNAPTINATLIKHGDWITWAEAGNWIPSENRHECSQCHDVAQVLINGVELLSEYCPNCGAKMDGGSNIDDDFDWENE